jgi:PAS domain S-box-containing protein
MKKDINILLVDDDDVDREAVIRYIRKKTLPYNLETAATESEAFKYLREKSFDIILLDYNLGTATGLEILPHVGDTPVIFVTGSGTEEIAVEAMRMGACDYLVKDPERNYLTVLPLTIRNALDHKQAEKALKESEARFRALTEKASDIVMILDKNSIFTYVSPSVRLFGYSPDEIKGKRAAHFVYPDDFPTWLEVLEAAINTPYESVKVPEFRMRRKDGSLFIVEGMFTCMIEEPGVKGVVFNGRDITERKEVETALKYAKEEADAANKARGEFLARMSHEIRTPMNAVMGMTRLLFKTGLSPKQQKYAAMIRNSADFLLAIVNDILDFSRIEAGKLEMESIDFNLETVLADTFEILSLNAGEKNLDFMTYIEPGVPFRLRGDPGRLRQVIINLVGNAVKFTESGSVSVHIRTERRDEEQVELRFEVTDTGIGIPADRLNLLFKAFTQVEKSTTRRYGGTGLGLSICKRLVEMMGGEIDVESEIGKGSTFRFTAVFKKQPPEENRETGQMEKEFADAAGGLRSSPYFLTEDERHNARILLAEDNVVNRELMIEQFESAGFASPLTAENGKEAVELALQYQPDLVLMDIQMPVMDGNEAIVLLKEKGYRGPVISLSAMAMKEDIERSLKAGAVDYITKPVDFDSFFVKIAKFLSTSSGKTGNGNTNNKVNGNSDSQYRIKDSVSKRIRDVFIKEASEKLKILNGITDASSLGEKKKELTFISHGYKGNARHLGLLPLEAAAAALNASLRDEAPAENVLELVAKLSRILNHIVEENEKQKK